MDTNYRIKPLTGGMPSATTSDMAYQLVYPLHHNPSSNSSPINISQTNGTHIRQQTASSPTSISLVSKLTIPGEAQVNGSPLELQIDFTRPDSQRTRPLIIDSKRLYVDEHYVSVWSPILRSWCIECPDRELILANVQYEHVLELLHAIHPTYKEIDDQTVHILLPLAYDYQVEIFF